MNEFKISSIRRLGGLKCQLVCVALVFYGTTARPALFDAIPGLSSAAQSSLIAYYDGRTGVVTGANSSVTSWAPVDGTGAPLASMVVTQSGSGLDIITYDGTSTLFFSSEDGNTSRQLRGNLVATAGTTYTVLWRGRHHTPAPFEGQGNYVYNIGNEINHQREVRSGVPAVELYDGSATYRGMVNVDVIDNATTIWSTVYNGRSHRAYADGFDLGIPGTPDYRVAMNPAILIGAFSPEGFNFNGELRDLIIFKSALSDADRILLENYLTKPELAVTRLGVNVRIVWPASVTNFFLEAASSLPSSNWELVTNTPVVNTGKLVLTNAASEPRRFYRLTQ